MEFRLGICFTARFDIFLPPQPTPPRATSQADFWRFTLMLSIWLISQNITPRKWHSFIIFALFTFLYSLDTPAFCYMMLRPYDFTGQVLRHRNISRHRHILGLRRLPPLRHGDDARARGITLFIIISRKKFTPRRLAYWAKRQYFSPASAAKAKVPRAFRRGMNDDTSI